MKPFSYRHLLLLLGPALFKPTAASAAKFLPAADAAIKTIYVSASGAWSGSGTATSPFVLAAGREYELNRLVHPLLDQKKPVRILFRDGIYEDVRLQIVREGVDTQAVYLLPFAGMAKFAPASALCNRKGGNCRVVSADFTMGSDTSTPLEIAAEHEGKVVFDGSRSRDAKPDVESDAITIAGATFDGPSDDPYRIRSKRISNISIHGIVFRNYRNGIHIHYATHISVSSCQVISIGNRSPRRSAQDHFGTFGISVDGSSYLILLKNNKVANIWNIGSEPVFAAAAADPGLIHGIYDGYSRDVIFLHNYIGYSSGPLVKWGFYPIVRNGVSYQYPDALADRRNFFVDNTFVLGVVGANKGGAVRSEYQAFIHDNSREVVAGNSTPPASGIVFLNNRFINLYPADSHTPVALLREELPLQGDKPFFPGWSFQNNKIINVADQLLLVDRQRGAALTAEAFHHGAEEAAVVDQLHLNQQSQQRESGSVVTQKHVQDLLKESLRSSNVQQDALVALIIAHGEMPIASNF